MKRALEDIYKRVERLVSEEGNHQVVVWRQMQDEFLKGYKRFTELIELCYPGAQIELGFNVDDLLNYFTTIART